MPYSVKRFRFRLQTLLSIEQNKEKQAQVTFKNAIDELRHQEALLAQLQEEYRLTQQAMLKDIQWGTSPQQLSAYDAYFNNLKSQMEEQQGRIAEAETAVETTRQELNERTKQRKILEKLRERAKESYDEEFRKVESTLMDEVGNSMTIRKMNE